MDQILVEAVINPDQSLVITAIKTRVIELLLLDDALILAGARGVVRFCLIIGIRILVRLHPFGGLLPLGSLPPFAFGLSICGVIIVSLTFGTGAGTPDRLGGRRSILLRASVGTIGLRDTFALSASNKELVASDMTTLVTILLGYFVPIDLALESASKF